MATRNMEDMSNAKRTYKRALTIAGSDPSGGAGIQADLKAFSACGCFGTSAIVAVVDENTVGVTGVHPVPVEFVVGQIRSVLDDIGADAIKIGMLHSSELIRAVKETLAHYAIRNIVLDPVMVATSGDALLQRDAVATLRDELIPCARVITPNIPEAELLLGERLTRQEELPDAARRLSRDGRVSVLLKAGHLQDNMLTDIFYNAETDRILPLRSPRVETVNTHGTGCTLSSAFAAFLARGFELDEAATRAKEYIAARSPPEPATRSATATGPCTTSSTSGSNPRKQHRQRQRPGRVGPLPGVFGCSARRIPCRNGHKRAMTHHHRHADTGVLRASSACATGSSQLCPVRAVGHVLHSRRRDGTAAGRLRKGPSFRQSASGCRP